MNRHLPFSQRVASALRSDMEFHGAAARLTVGVAVSLLLAMGMAAGKFALSWGAYAAFFSYFFVLSFLLTADIFLRPGRNWRIYLGILFDMTTTTIAVVLTGPVLSVLFPLYLWITVTNGVRFGRRKMVVAAATAILFYNGQLIAQGLWRANMLDAVISVLFLTIFPAYFSHMISALHQARRDAENANRAKSDFLANMTHELRTPMVGVTALSSLLAGTRLTSEQQGYVTTLQSSARLLTRLIDDLLDLSRIEAGKFELRREGFNPARAIGEVIELVAQLAAEKGLALRGEIDPRLAPVIGDEVRFKEVLVNLLGNAVKFTANGEVVIRAEVLGQVDGALQFRCEVEDTGIGIAPELLPHVFDRFHQGDNSPSRVYQGAGLGTTIAKHLVEMMGGTIGVASEPGKGTRFWFQLVLPLAAQTMAAAAPPPEPVPQGRPQGRILLVEDNAINAMAIRTILQKSGHTVDLAEDGWQALAAQAAHPYALVFLDLQLPGMDGPEVARIWREREQDRPTPIIALTANASTGDRDLCLAAGMDDFLSKPVETSRLLAVAAHYCDRAAAQEKLVKESG